jgi:hypothetical protein
MNLRRGPQKRNVGSSITIAIACELLAPVYGWFTEGHDILDLKEAKVLLDDKNEQDVVVFREVLERIALLAKDEVFAQAS